MAGEWVFDFGGTARVIGVRRPIRKMKGVCGAWFIINESSREPMNKIVQHIGRDVHKETIAASIATSESQRNAPRARKFGALLRSGVLGAIALFGLTCAEAAPAAAMETAAYDRSLPGRYLVGADQDGAGGRSTEATVLPGQTTRAEPAASAPQYVEVTTELEIAGYFRKGMERALRVSSHSHAARVVFGTNTWLIDESRPGVNDRTLWLFANATITEFGAGTGNEFAGRPSLERIHETTGSQDGNPGRTVGNSDVLSYTAFLNWYAFCSAPALNGRERALFPPSDLWKRYVTARRFEVEVVRFEDSLGLPRSLDLYTTNQQPVFQYRIAAMTNFMGWSVPLEFHAVQYDPAGTNGWQVQFTAKGRVKSIHAGKKPSAEWGGLK